MDLPPVSDARWHPVVLGKNRYKFEFFALNMMLTRIRLAIVNKDQRPEIEWVTELRALLQDNADLPSVQRDVAQMFGGHQ